MASVTSDDSAKPGCSKCRYSTNGCVKCRPQTSKQRLIEPKLEPQEQHASDTGDGDDAEVSTADFLRSSGQHSIPERLPFAPVCEDWPPWIGDSGQEQDTGFPVMISPPGAATAPSEVRHQQGGSGSGGKGKEPSDAPKGPLTVEVPEAVEKLGQQPGAEGVAPDDLHSARAAVAPAPVARSEEPTDTPWHRLGAAWEEWGKWSPPPPRPPLWCHGFMMLT
mmetsp:Transcript_38448/g.108654  ORF Transcript_38448/g.108654 Transcript_38448/m.108654 type:complete len:221 (+) Transcript_38448:199-861(+)